MTDPNDPMINIDVIVYDDSDDLDTLCERHELMEESLEVQDRLFNVVVVGKA